MLALYRSGRQAEALEAYHDARAALDELGHRAERAPARARAGDPHARRDARRERRLSSATRSSLPGPLRVVVAVPVRRSRARAHRRCDRCSARRGRRGRTGRCRRRRGRQRQDTARARARPRGGRPRRARALRRLGRRGQRSLPAVRRGARVPGAGVRPDRSRPLSRHRARRARANPPRPEPGAAPGERTIPRPNAVDSTSAVVELLTRVSRQRPLLSIVDDLHWADATSLRLFRPPRPRCHGDR